MFACCMLARQTLVHFGTLGAEIIGARQGKMGSDLARHRHELKEKLKQTSGQTSVILLQLLAIASENPPGDTTLLAQEVSTILQSVPGIDVELVSAVHPIAHVVAVIHGRAPGRRLVFNGHLDTFEIGDSSAWSASPYGELKVGRIYGRGSADMKGGLAAQIYAALRLAEFRNCWQGELSLILTGDEETAGPHGTQYLLETRRPNLAYDRGCGQSWPRSTHTFDGQRYRSAPRRNFCVAFDHGHACENRPTYPFSNR